MERRCSHTQQLQLMMPMTSENLSFTAAVVRCAPDTSSCSAQVGDVGSNMAHGVSCHPLLYPPNMKVVSLCPHVHVILSFCPNQQPNQGSATKDILDILLLFLFCWFFVKSYWFKSCFTCIFNIIYNGSLCTESSHLVRTQTLHDKGNLLVTHG